MKRSLFILAILIILAAAAYAEDKSGSVQSTNLISLKMVKK